MFVTRYWVHMKFLPGDSLGAMSSTCACKNKTCLICAKRNDQLKYPLTPAAALAGWLARWRDDIFLQFFTFLNFHQPIYLSQTFLLQIVCRWKLVVFKLFSKLLWFIKDKPWCNRWDGFIPVKKYLAFPVTNIMHRYFCKIETKPRFCLLVPSVYVFIYCFCLKYLGKN